MDSDSQNHLLQLRQAYERRLKVLELREAHQGLDTPAHIIIEIQDLRYKIEHIDYQIKNINTNTSVRISELSKSQEVSITDLVEQFNEAIRKELWDTVIAFGEKILIINADHPTTRFRTAEAYAICGKEHHRSHEFQQAMEYLTRAIILNPKEADYYQWRGYNYYCAIGYKISVVDYNKAISDYSKAISLSPGNADYIAWRGEIYFRAAVDQHPIGNYKKALSDYSEAIKINPTNGDYYEGRSIVHDTLNNHSAARRDSDKAAHLFGIK